MGLMIYMMVMNSHDQEHGGFMPEEQNLVPGLSILNLAFFLLCTPVQVRNSPVGGAALRVALAGRTLMTLFSCRTRVSCTKDASVSLFMFRYAKKKK